MNVLKVERTGGTLSVVMSEGTALSYLPYRWGAYVRHRVIETSFFLLFSMFTLNNDIQKCEMKS